MREFDKQKFIEDMRMILESILREHPHPNLTQEQIDSIILNYENSYLDTFNSSFYYLQTKIAEIGDSHTTVSLPTNDICVSRLRFKMVDGKYVVSEAYGKDYLLGLPLSSINGVDINTIAYELSKTVPGKTEEGMLQEIALDLSNKSLLKTIPSYVDMNGVINYSFEGLNNPYQESLSDKNIDVIMDYEKPKVKYKYEIKDGVGIITIKACGKNQDEFNEFVNIIKNSQVNSYIVDLRGNKGGKSSTIDPLIDYLKSEINIGQKEAYTIVDGEVFSSGIITAYRLKDIGTTIVGTELAEKGNHFGQPLVLPDSPNYGISSMVSKKFFGYTLNEDGRLESLDNSIDSKEEYEALRRDLSKHKYINSHYLKPDIEKKEKIEDIRSKRDSVMEYIINQINTKNIEFQEQYLSQNHGMIR